jgi:hypothetical protein
MAETTTGLKRWDDSGSRTKSAFIRFGNVAIFNKWLWMDA